MGQPLRITPGQLLRQYAEVVAERDNLKRELADARVALAPQALKILAWDAHEAYNVYTDILGPNETMEQKLHAEKLFRAYLALRAAVRSQP